MIAPTLIKTEVRIPYVIYGYGRVGRRIAEEFRAAGVPYVVLDYVTIPERPTAQPPIFGMFEYGAMLVANTELSEDADRALTHPFLLKKRSVTC